MENKKSILSKMEESTRVTLPRTSFTERVHLHGRLKRENTKAPSLMAKVRVSGIYPGSMNANTRAT